MNRAEFVRGVTQMLRDNNVRKTTNPTRQVFHISDDQGTTKDFVVKKEGRKLQFTVEDVDAIVEACTELIVDTLKNGGNIDFRGFGSLGLKYRAARQTLHPATGEVCLISPHYIPYFTAGNKLKLGAKTFEMYVNDYLKEIPPLDELPAKLEQKRKQDAGLIDEDGE